MIARRFLISFLGLAALAVPASATTTFYTGTNSQTLFNNATTGLFFPDPLTSFVPGDLTVTGLEYDDPGTLASFLGFSNPLTPAALAVVGTNLQAPPIGYIQVLLPSAVYAFAATITKTAGGTGIFCVEVNNAYDGNCTGTVVVTSTTDDEFFGIVSTTAFQSIWLAPGFGNPTLSMLNFEIGEQQPPPATPEVATAVLIGSGLILVPVFRRRLRLRLAV